MDLVINADNFFKHFQTLVNIWTKNVRISNKLYVYTNDLCLKQPEFKEMDALFFINCKDEE